MTSFLIIVALIAILVIGLVKRRQYKDRAEWAASALVTRNLDFLIDANNQLKAELELVRDQKTGPASWKAAQELDESAELSQLMAVLTRRREQVPRRLDLSRVQEEIQSLYLLAHNHFQRHQRIRQAVHQLTSKS